MTQMTLDISPEQLARKHPVHTGKNGYEHYRRTFVSLFKETARNHHRYEVFRDFAEMAALAMQNAFLKSPTLEKELPGGINLMTYSA